MSYQPAVLEIRTLDDLDNQITLVDLLNFGNGITLKEWRPKRAALKGGGVYQDSPFADGRRLVHAVYDSVTETLVLTMVNDDPDGTFYHDNDLTDALQDAINYSRSTWGQKPVFLALLPRGATNEQYALINNGRTDEFENPFGTVAYQFFAPRSIADEIPLIIEREHWLENPPTLSTAVPLAAVQAFPETFALSFSREGDLVDCGSDATVDNLPTGANGFTIEAWVKLSRLVDIESNGRIGDKGWLFTYSNPNGLVGQIPASTTTGVSQSGVMSLDDQEWHHIAMTYRNSGGRVIQLWLDGIEVNYATQTAVAGTVTGDAGDDFLIGNQSAGTRVFPGLIGWVRLSNTRRYTSDFTPPDRCAPPDVDANTVAQWNMQEGNGSTVDNAEGTAGSDGAITGAIWSSARIDGAACGVRNYGNVDDSAEPDPTTDNEAFVSNKHTMAQITNWHIGTGGANRIDQTFPTQLHNATGTGSTYFGVDDSMPNSGPFDSLVFDIETVQVGATVVWEYWNGAWVTLSVTDNSEGFTNKGVHSVHWIPPSDWAKASPGGSIPSGYYVRVRTTVAGSVDPTQQNRNPYTICWPYVEIAASAVPGNIKALARLWLHGQSGDSTARHAPKAVFLALRSVSKGGAFTPFINLGDTQLLPGTTVAASSGATVSTNLYAPSGRAIDLAKGTGQVFPIVVEFNETIAPQYRGKFRIFLRYTFDITGTDYDLSLQFNANINLFQGDLFHTTDTLTTTAGAGDLRYLDFGEVIIPDYVDEFEIVLVAQGSNTTAQITIVDIIVLPVDEWSARFDDPTLIGATVTYGLTPHLGVLPRHYLDLNHLNPKGVTSELIRTEGDVTKALFTPQVGHIFFQNNEKQRIFFFQVGEPASNTLWSRPFNSLSVQAFRNAQFLGFRGDR